MNAKNIPSIHFWSGNDDFSMQEILHEEKVRLREKNSNADINDFDFADAESRFELEKKARNALRDGSLFCVDKFTVIRNFWSTQRKSKKKDDEEAEDNRKNKRADFEEFLLEHLQRMNSHDRIFFLESRDLDKRGRAYKVFEGLVKKGRVEKKAFSVPLGFQLNAWLEARMKQRGGKISKADLDFLAMLLGRGMEQRERGGAVIAAYDLYQAAGEIDKLITHADGGEITREDVLLMVSASSDMNIFNLIESIGRRDKNRALNILSGQLEKGFNENYILTMLAYHFRNLINIRSLLDESAGAGEIARRTKMHPMIVEKNIKYARSFSLHNLLLIYEKIYSADISIKTGKMEPELALDMLIAAI